MEVDDFLDRGTEFGCKIRDLHMKGGHCLVYKVRVSDQSSGEFGQSIHLPDIVVKKSVGNLKSIRGFVVLSSAPYCRHAYEVKYETSVAYGESIRRKYPKKVRGEYVFLPDEKGNVIPGIGIVYNSYNVGHVHVEDLQDPLVVVRETDVLCTFPVENMSSVCSAAVPYAGAQVVLK